MAGACLALNVRWRRRRIYAWSGRGVRRGDRRPRESRSGLWPSVVIGVSEALTWRSPPRRERAAGVIFPADRPCCSRAPGEVLVRTGTGVVAAAYWARAGSSAFLQAARVLRVVRVPDPLLDRAGDLVQNILCYSGYSPFGHGASTGNPGCTRPRPGGKFDVPFLWTLPAAACRSPRRPAWDWAGVVFPGAPPARRTVRADHTLAVTFVISTII